MDKWNFEQIIRYIERRLGIKYIDNIDEKAFILVNNIYQLTIVENLIVKGKYKIIVKDSYNLKTVYSDSVYNFKQLEAVIMNIKKNILPKVYEEVADRMLKENNLEK